MRLYNSQSRTIEPFIPLKKNQVKLYVCGITPYDTTHLGHAFTYLTFDVLVRYLRYKKFEVTYTQNVTDIDDDILMRAKKEQRDWKELGKYWTEQFLKDMKVLNILPPTHFVKATESISTMIGIIRVLTEREIAYESAGNVYFDVSKFKKYGTLSQYKKKAMVRLLRERGGNPNDLNKRNTLDFILWQEASREPFWDSPFGKGRPGWHIECSAMINDTLGKQIDIHGGGKDLIYPHNESEIAQSESFTEKPPFVRYWMHVAIVYYRKKKMSKSLGNLVMVSDLLKKYSANAIRLTLLSHHYRTPWEFIEEEIIQNEDAMKILKNNLNFSFPKEVLTHYLDRDLNIPSLVNNIKRKLVTHVQYSSYGTNKTMSIENVLSLLGFYL